jgi:muramoyltetrapeptide carboxypeptidase
MNAALWFLSFLACVGCAEVDQKAAPDGLTIKPPTAGEQPPRTNALRTDMCNDIYTRIGKLDIIGVSPGSGMYPSLKNEMSQLASTYGINIPLSALEDKSYYQCADTDENRLKAFLDAANSDQKIVWAVRGGFGSSFIINELDKMPIPPRKKILVGFSDTTSLHLFVTKKWGWTAIHGSVLMYLCRQNFTNTRFDTLVDILEEKRQSYEIAPLYALNKAAANQKIIEGKLTGGNLTSLEASIGTSWEFQAENKIIFVEDINVLPWWLYRSMYHLKESGRLNGARAIVFGRFCGNNSQQDFVAYMKKFADLMDIPVFVTNEFGHGNNNQPLIYEANAAIREKRLIIDARSSRPVR